jgi:membrane associated rhomboid family serine protease
VISGALVFGIPYLYSAFIASVGEDATRGTDTRNGASGLYVPVLGPFITMGQTDWASARFVLALDGLAQTAGAIMLIYGLTSPRNVLVRNDLAMMVMPMMIGKDGQGVGVLGRF